MPAPFFLFQQTSGDVIVTTEGIAYASGYLYEVILEGDSAWTDITADVLWTSDLSYGVEGNDPLAVTASPGKMSFLLQNSDALGRYSPGHPSCLPGWTFGIPFRFRVIYNGRTYPRFRGKVHDILPDADPHGTRDVEVTAYDIFKDLEDVGLREIGIQINSSESETLKAVLAALPSDLHPVAEDLDVGLDTFEYALADIGSAPRALSVVADVARSSSYFVAAKSDGTFIGRNRQTRANSSVIYSFDNDFSDIVTPSDIEGVYRLVRSTIHPPTIDSVAKVLFALTGAVPSIAPGATLTLWGQYATGDTVKQLIGAIYVIDGVLGPTDYAANAAIDGSGLDVSSFIKVTATAFGADVKFEIVSASANTAYLIAVGGAGPKLQIRGQGVYDRSPQSFESARGPKGRDYEMDLRYLSDPHVAAALATYMQSIFNKVKPSELTFVANDSPAKMRLALTAEPADSVTVTAAMSGLAGLRLIVQSVALSFDEHFIRCTLGLAPGNVFIFWQWGIAGRSEWGETTVYGI